MSVLVSLSKFTRLQKLAFIALTFGYIASCCTRGSHGPFIPREAIKRNVTQGEVGLIFGFDGVIGLCAGPLLGMLIGCMGAKVALLFSCAGTGILSVMIGLMEHITTREWFLAGLIGLFPTRGMVGSLHYMSILTCAANLYPEHLSLIIGATETYVSIAEVVTLFCVGVLYDLGGFQLSPFVFGSIQLLSFPMYYYLLPPGGILPDSPGRPKEEAGTADGDKPKLQFWHLAKIPAAMMMAGTLACSSFGWSLLETTFELRLRPMEVSGKAITSIFLLLPAFYGIASPLWGFLSDKMPRAWPLMTTGSIVSGILLILFGPLPIPGWESTIPHHIIFLSLLGMTFAAANIPACSGCMKHTIEAGYPDNTATNGVVSSLIVMGYGMGGTAGSSSAGFLAETLGHVKASAIFGSIILAWGLIVTMYFLCCHKFPPGKNVRNDSQAKNGEQQESFDGNKDCNTSIVSNQIEMNPIKQMVT